MEKKGFSEQSLNAMHTDECLTHDMTEESSILIWWKALGLVYNKYESETEQYLKSGSDTVLSEEAE